MRKRKRYSFIPRDAWNWKKVMDITSGRGIAPFRKGRRIIEYEEYKENVPKQIKHLRSPHTPNVGAAMH